MPPLRVKNRSRRCPPGSVQLSSSNRWRRCANPPANGSNPSGVHRARDANLKNALMLWQHADQLIDFLIRVVKMRRSPQSSFAECDLDVMLFSQRENQLIVIVL